MEHSDNPVTTKPSSIKVIDLEDDDLWPPNNADSENEFYNVEDYDSDDSFPVIPNTFPVSKVLSRNKTQNPKLPYEAILKVHKEIPKESIVSWELMTKAQRITTINHEVQSIWFAKDADARKPRIDNIQNNEEPLTVKSATPECVYTPENLTRILSTVSKSKSNASINFVMSGIMGHGRVSDELLQSVTIDPSQKDRYHNEIVYPFHPYGSENKNHHTLNKRMTNANAIYNVPVNNDDQELTCLWKSCNTVVRGMHHFVNHVFIKHVEMTTNLKCQWDSCTRVTPFTAQYMLILHLRRHTGERPHVCYYTNCHKSYSRLENLKTHIRTHTGERPYRCENVGCEKTFYNASDRAKHQSRTHGAAKSFECYVVGCKKIYTDPSSLRKHIKSIHGVACYDLVKRAKMQQLREGRRYRIYIPTVAVAESVMELCSEDDLKQRGIIVENEVEPVVESYIFCEDDEDLSMYLDEVKSDDNQSQQIQPNVIDSNGRYSCDEEFIDVVSVSPQPSTSRDSGIEATSSRSGTVCSDISFSAN